MLADRIDKIKTLVEPAVRDEGCELWDIEAAGKAGAGILRIYIDKPGGVTVEDCANVSRRIDMALEAEGVIEERYTLEVSSPGLTRPLRKPLDFIRATGKLALVKLRKPVEDDFKPLVIIESADENAITVTLKKDGQKVTIPYSDIARANLEIEF